MYYKTDETFFIFSKVAKLKNTYSHGEIFAPLDISDLGESYDFIQSKDIYDVRLKYEEFCDRFYLHYKLKSDKTDIDYCFVLINSILMDIFQQVGIDKDGYIHDTDFYFAGKMDKYRKEISLCILPSKLKQVRNELKNLDNYYMEPEKNIEFKNIKEGDLIKYKNNFYFVIKKINNINVRTKKAKSADQLQIKLETKPFLYLYDFKELMWNLYMNRDSGDDGIFLHNSAVCKTHPLGKHALIFNENTNLKSALHYKLSDKDNYYSKLFHSELAKAIFKKITREDYRSCNSSLIKTYLYSNISTKTDKSDFIDDKGYFLVNRKGLNDFKKVISSITTTKTTTKEILEEIAPYDENKLKKIITFEDLKKQKIYIDEEGNPIIVLDKSLGIMPECLIDKILSSKTLVKIKATDEIKSYIFYIKDLSNDYSQKIYIEDFENKKFFEYVAEDTKEMESRFVKRYQKYDEYLRKQNSTCCSIKNGDILSTILKNKPIKSSIYKFFNEIEIETDASNCYEFLNLIKNYGLGYFSDDKEELEENNYLFCSGDNLESLFKNEKEGCYNS